MDDTIVALATPRGKSALAIIRLSGTGAPALCGRCVVERERFAACAPRTIGLFTFTHPRLGRAIDQVTMITYRNPASFTGEDMVEIFCHGGPVIIDKILQACVESGARYAGPGEFTRRAVLNGKMPLLKAEAIGALIDSVTDNQHDSAIRGYRGEYGMQIEEYKRTMVRLLSQAEVSIEFPDEDDVASVQTEIRAGIEQLAASVDRELEKRKKIGHADTGTTVALVGERNVGKSSIFNELLHFDRSLVHEDKGTTRDYVSEPVCINGIHATLIDTAGIGESCDSVESLGIGRSWELVERTDLVMLVCAADMPVCEYERKIIAARGARPIIGVVNKTDLAPGTEHRAFFTEQHIPWAATSARSGNPHDDIDELLDNAMRKIRDQSAGYTMILNTRQEQAVLALSRELRSALGMGAMHECVADCLKNALDRIAEFAGDVCSEEVLDAVFSTFCIGK